MNLYDEFIHNNVEYFVNPQPHNLSKLSDKFNILYVNVIKLISENRRNLFSLFISDHGIIFDAIVLCETGFSSAVDALQISHYDAFHNCRLRSGGGVSIYILEKYKARETLSDTFQENQIILVNIPGLHINIGSLYRQQRSSANLFCEWLDRILSSNKNLIICGDMNLNLAATESTSVQSYIDTIKSNNFLYLNNTNPQFYTRACSTTKTFIDHCLSDKLNLKYSFLLFDHSISDHRYFIISFKHENPAPSPQTTTINKINYNLVHNSAITLLNSPNIKFDFFYKELKQLISINTYQQSVTIKKINLLKPWFNKTLLSTKKNRDRCYKLMKKYSTNGLYKLQFLSFKAELISMIKKEKSIYFSNQLNLHLDNPKKIWNIFKEIMFGKKVEINQTNITTLTINNIQINNANLIAENLNEYFINIGQKLADLLPLINSPPPQMITFQTSFDKFLPTTEDEILNSINGLKNGSSSGLDKITVKLAKSLAKLIAAPLSSAINECFNSGKFPDDLKSARVTAIFKAGDRTNPSNYRPISVLSIFYKLIEFAIKSRLENYLIESKIINKHQYGFQKGSNTTAAALNLMNTIYTNLNKNQKTSSIYIDCTKAFDSMNFSILINKLKLIGIGGSALQLLNDYIHNRHQTVIVNGIQSSFLEIVTGSGQGTVLAPTLYIIYTNDIFDIKLHGNLQMYADDCVCTYGANNFVELYSQMSADAVSLYNWFTKNKLTMSISKTQFMIYYQRNTNLSDIFNNIQLTGINIVRVDNYKYLGLIINTALNFNSHIDYIKKKITPYIAILNRCKQILSTPDLKKIYFAFIHSSICYMLPIYSAAPDTKLNELAILQKRAVKNVYKLKWDHPTSTLFRENIFPLNKLIDIETCILFFKLKNNLTKNDLQLQTRINISNTLTRQHSLHSNTFTSREYILKSFFFKAPNLYNSLPISILSETSIIKFKTLLKEHISDQSLSQHIS